MSFNQLLCALDIIGLGMLLGGGVYESIVMAPNYRNNVPESINHIRQFMKVTTPANYFRVFSPATMILLLVTVVITWNSGPAFRWIAAAFILHVITDMITYSYHYPRNKVLFIDELSSDTDLVRRYAREWGIANGVRVVLLTLSVGSALIGLIQLSGG